METKTRPSNEQICLNDAINAIENLTPSLKVALKKIESGSTCETDYIIEKATKLKKEIEYLIKRISE